MTTGHQGQIQNLLTSLNPQLLSDAWVLGSKPQHFSVTTHFEDDILAMRTRITFCGLPAGKDSRTGDVYDATLLMSRVVPYL